VTRTAVALVCTAALLSCVGCGGANPAATPTRSTPTPPDRTGPEVEQPAADPRQDTPFSLLQMNLCLSGYSGCFARTAYPAVVDEAVRVIRERRPDAVSLNEACARDAREIARRTGYHVRFTEVIYADALLPCVDPGGRGLFGNALLTKARVTQAREAKFTAQLGPEERRWLCATTATDVTVCSAHLEGTTGSDRRANNERQCEELASLLTRYARQRPTIFAGDANRQGWCAPEGHWVVTDSEASGASGTDPGIQHVYGSRDFASPRGTVVPAARSDHDYLFVQTRLRARRNRRCGGCAA
jgi:endonuclease/exonuclease/phosphatase family metal-dependent hydrolase